MIAMFKLFYNTIAACQRPVGPLLSIKCKYNYMDYRVATLNVTQQTVKDCSQYNAAGINCINCRPTYSHV